MTLALNKNELNAPSGSAYYTPSSHHLEDLDLWGGAFYTDGLCDLLEQIGHQLKKLSLVHVEEIDWRAIAIITIACPNLIKLGVQNCEFMDEDDGQGEERSANDVVDPFRYKE